MNKMTTPSWIAKNYACATRSSLPADRFHTETSGRFAFTWYRCVSSYRSEILAPLQQPGWTQAGVTRAVMASCAAEVSSARKSPWCYVNTPLAGWFFFYAFLVTYSERLATLEVLRKTQLKSVKYPQLQSAMWNLTRATIWCEALTFCSTFLQDCSHAGVAGLLIYLLKEQVNQALCVSSTLKL